MLNIYPIYGEFAAHFLLVVILQITLYARGKITNIIYASITYMLVLSMLYVYAILSMLV